MSRRAGADVTFLAPQFQNRRAKVKKLAERAERANGGQSTTARATTADNDSDDQVGGGDDVHDGDETAHTRLRTASAPSSSRRPRPSPRYSSSDPSVQYDSESAELPDPTEYVGAPRAHIYGEPPQQQESATNDELRLPLPPNPNDHFAYQGNPSASGRRYSLPAFASSVIPPSPHDQNGHVAPSHPSSLADAYPASLYVPSSASGAGGNRQHPSVHSLGSISRQHPSMHSLGSASSHADEHSPAQSVSSRASETIPDAIPEYAEVSHWNSAPGSAPEHPSTGYLAARRSSVPSRAIPMYDGDNRSTRLSMPVPEEAPTQMGANGDEPGLAYNPAVYPPPVSMIDPVASVAFLHGNERVTPVSYPYSYVQPSATMQDVSDGMVEEAPLYVTAEELGGGVGR